MALNNVKLLQSAPNRDVKTPPLMGVEAAVCMERINHEMSYGAQNIPSIKLEGELKRLKLNAEIKALCSDT